MCCLASAISYDRIVMACIIDDTFFNNMQCHIMLFYKSSPNFVKCPLGHKKKDYSL